MHICNLRRRASTLNYVCNLGANAGLFSHAAGCNIFAPRQTQKRQRDCLHMCEFNDCVLNSTTTTRTSGVVLLAGDVTNVPGHAPVGPRV